MAIQIPSLRFRRVVQVKAGESGREKGQESVRGKGPDSAAVRAEILTSRDAEFARAAGTVLVLDHSPRLKSIKEHVSYLNQNHNTQRKRGRIR